MDFSDLECHFTWQPEVDDEEKHLDKVFDRTLKGMKHEDDVNTLIMPLLAYVQCKISQKKYGKALTLIEKFLKHCDTLKMQESALGYKTVGLGNKSFILREMGRTEDAQKILKDIKKLDDLTDKEKAAVYGVHAFALGMFGTSKYNNGIELYTKAKKLDRDNYLWHFGSAFLAGRVRRVEEGVRTQPTEMEEESFRTACELTEWKKPIPIIFLAEIIFARGRDFTGTHRHEDVKALEDAKRFYKMAYELGSDSPTVLKKCGKGFALLDEEELGEECLRKAIEMDPSSSQAHHKLAQIYEFGKKKKNLRLAKKYYSTAVTVGRRRNYFAECDLCRVKKKIDVTYSTISHYESMRQHYEFDEKRLEHINKKISDVKEYNENKRKQANEKKSGRRHKY